MNEFFRGVRALGMCMYDRTRLPASLVDHGLATHSCVALAGRYKKNQFYELPAAAVGRAAQPDKLAWKIAALQKDS